jgi:SAM-dependent methyltransferase
MKSLPIDKKQWLSLQVKKHDTEKKRKSTAYRTPYRLDDAHLLLKAAPHAKSILCVGARDDSEVKDFLELGLEGCGVDVALETKLIQRADVHNLPFPDKSFDIVYCSHVLEHCHDAPKALAEVGRVAKLLVLVILPFDNKLNPNHPTMFEVMKKAPKDGKMKVNEAVLADFEKLQPFRLDSATCRTIQSAAGAWHNESVLLFCSPLLG